MIIILRALLLLILTTTVSISAITPNDHNHNIKDVSLTNDSSSLGKQERIPSKSSSDSDDENSSDKDFTTTTGNSGKDGVTEQYNNALFGNDDLDHEHDVKDYLAKKQYNRKLKQSVQKQTKANSNIKRVFGKLSFVRKKQVSYIDINGFFPEQDETAPSSSEDESLDYQPEHFKQDRAEFQALKYYLLTQIPTTPLPPNDIILSPHSVALRAAVLGLDRSLARLEHEESRREYMKLTKDDAAVYMEDVEEWETTPFINQDDDSSDSDEDEDMPPPSTNKKKPNNKLKKKRPRRKRYPRYRGNTDYHFRNFPHSFFE